MWTAKLNLKNKTNYLNHKTEGLQCNIQDLDCKTEGLERKIKDLEDNKRVCSAK